MSAVLSTRSVIVCIDLGVVSKVVTLLGMGESEHMVFADDDAGAGLEWCGLYDLLAVDVYECSVIGDHHHLVCNRHENTTMW